MGQMTIDELAELMQKGFSDSDKKIDKLTKSMQQGFVDSDKKTDEKIEELARMIAGGFGEVHDKFDKVNGKFENIDGKFVEVTGKILESEERTKGIIKSEIRSLENRVNSNHGAMVSEFIKIHGRSNILEKKVDKIDQRTMKDDNIIFTDIHNLKKGMTVYEGYFKKLGINVPAKKGAK